MRRENAYAASELMKSDPPTVRSVTTELLKKYLPKLLTVSTIMKLSQCHVPEGMNRGGNANTSFWSLRQVTSIQRNGRSMEKATAMSTI